MHLAKQQIGPLAAVVVPGQSDRTIVLCHGYGADASDLAPLCRYMDPQQQYSWVFPDAPLEIPLGPHMVGRAWFPIVASDLQRLIEQQDQNLWLNRRPDGLDEAGKLLGEFLVALKIPMPRILIGGFSQGSMVSLDLVLQQQLDVAGVGILSGTLLSRDQWQRWAGQGQPRRYFQSHGGQDGVLPFALAQALNQQMNAWGWQGATHFFEGGHEIPYPLLSAWMQFVHEVLPL